LLFRIILNKLTPARNITQLQIGEDAVIMDFANGFVACKLMSMGLLAGTVFTLVRKAPFGGAYYIKTKNHIIGLRTDEAVYVLTKSS
jgi:ferrous iron transport protein A